MPFVFASLYFWTHSRGQYALQVTLLTYFLIAFAKQTSENTLRFAVERVVAILIGCLWATICSALLWPHQAATQLHDNCFASVHAFHKAFDRMLLLTVGWARREDRRLSLEMEPPRMSTHTR